MTKNAIIIFSLIFFLTIAMLFPYYSIKDEISLNNETLSSIGGYISGGVSILNLCVFV